MGIGLALSGGGAKGIAHIGVIKALIDNGINIDYISGTSSGSIIASLFAAGYSPNEILNIILNNRNNIIDIDKNNFNFFKILINKKADINGFIKGNKLEKLIRNALNYKNIIDINDVKLPLAITTVNLNNGKTVYFSNKLQGLDNNDMYINGGKLASIVRASISVPGIFIPQKIENNYYIDGGVKVNSPVNILKKMGAEKVICVSFEDININKFGIKNVSGICNNVYENICNSLNNEEIYADVNIKLCIKNISIFDTSKPIYLANRGYNIVSKNIYKIKQILKNN